MKPQYRNQTRVFDLFGELKPHLQARQSELTTNNTTSFASAFVQVHKTDWKIDARLDALHNTPLACALCAPRTVPSLSLGVRSWSLQRVQFDDWRDSVTTGMRQLSSTYLTTPFPSILMNNWTFIYAGNYRPSPSGWCRYQMAISESHTHISTFSQALVWTFTDIVDW